MSNNQSPPDPEPENVTNLPSTVPHQDLKTWYQSYKVEEGNELTKDHPLILAVNDDTLSEEFIEQKIQELSPKSLATKNFCSPCQSLFNNWPTLGASSTRQHDSSPTPGGWEHATVRPCTTFELEGGARVGCRFCAFLLQGLKDIQMLETYRKIEQRIHDIGEKDVMILSIQNWGGNPLQILWLNFPGKVCDSCNSGIGVEMKFTSSFLPAEADCYDDQLDVMDSASKWMSVCSESHELCRNNQDSTLPTRLISISEKEPRLVLTSELPASTKYSTLSHIWGGRDPIKLTFNTFDSFLKALPEDLPKTFQDAFKITRKLGLDYIWIDSLCIIQDSESDWEKESALMTSVYGNSTITIAASSAQNSTEGCFLKPPYFSGGLRARIIDGGNQRVQDFRSSDIYDLSTSDTPLGARAWALQEKMLPPRTIHFSDRGAFWECRELMASEYLPEGFPKMLVSPLVRRKGKIEWLWPQIVRLYTAANLTFGKDKLPALSGIARLAFNETGDQYLAGLWRGQVEEQLCWRYWSTHTAKQRPVWRAPSWSWASVDTSVNWHGPQPGVLDTRYAHVLDATMTNHGPDPFGQLTHGELRLSCSAMATGYLVKTKEEDGGKGIIKLHGNEDQEFNIQIDCLNEVSQDHPIHLIPMFGGYSGMGWIKDEIRVEEMMIQGLVLRRSGAKRGEFSRIGFFSFYKDSSDFFHQGDVEEETYDQFVQVIEEHGKATAEAVCFEVISNELYPDEKYVITLV